jgi:hypothetical protein
MDQTKSKKVQQEKARIEEFWLRYCSGESLDRISGIEDISAPVLRRWFIERYGKSYSVARNHTKGRSQNSVKARIMLGREHRSLLKK